MLPVIVIPTYNEKENLENIVRQVLGLETGVSILVVDDNSPDGTGDIADRLADEFPQVQARHREGKQGLGSAYRYGFREALDMGADCVFEMDADFQHDPKYIPRFLEAIRQHDVVIGSRYVEGGGTEGWSRMREVVSRGGSAYARFFTGMTIRDTTSGFRCHRREVLEALPLDRMDAAGFGFQVELAYLCTILGFDIFELPIIFVDRRVGESKMSKDIFWEAMRMVAGLKKKYKDIDGRK